MENYFLFAKWTLKGYGKCLKESQHVPVHDHLTLSGKDFILALNSTLRTWSMLISLKQPGLFFG